jgi:Uma2 family endonuclease
MGSITPTRLLTFEEFERMPEQPGKQELLEGELIELPPAETKQGRGAHRTYHRLLAALETAQARGDARNLGEVFMEMGYRLSKKSYVQPDVSVTHAGQHEEKYFALAPAIAIEIVSPSNSAQDLETKTELYFRYGALEVWRFYRKTKHARVDVGATSRVEHETITTPLLPGFTLNLADVFGPAKL